MWAIDVRVEAASRGPVDFTGGCTEQGVKRKLRGGAVRVAVTAMESSVQVKSIRDNTSRLFHFSCSEES